MGKATDITQDNLNARDKSMSLTDNETGKSWELPLLEGTYGPPVIDVRNLYGETGYFTFDPSYTSTASCKSRLTYIDGEEGILLHRGYNIKDLTERSSFIEVAYALLYGDLPNESQLEDFTHNITYHTMVHEQIHFFFRGFRRDSHPMAIMCGIVGGLSAFYHDSLDIWNPEHREISAHRLIAKMPTLTAMAYKYSLGQPFMYPRNDLSYAENFLYMCFGVPAEPYEVNPVLARAMDKILILHADHEQNCSTNAMRSIGSSHADPFSAVAGAAAARPPP